MWGAVEREESKSETKMPADTGMQSSGCCGGSGGMAAAAPGVKSAVCVEGCAGQGLLLKARKNHARLCDFLRFLSESKIFCLQLKYVDGLGKLAVLNGCMLSIKIR